MPLLKRVKISGSRGVWTAVVEGRTLGVLHASWRRGATDYFDPMLGGDPVGVKFRDLVKALTESELAVIQRDKGEGLARDGYIGVFRFKDLIVGPDGSISLTITERYAEAQ